VTRANAEAMAEVQASVVELDHRQLVLHHRVSRRTWDFKLNVYKLFTHDTSFHPPTSFRNVTFVYM